MWYVIREFPYDGKTRDEVASTFFYLKDAIDTMNYYRRFNLICGVKDIRYYVVRGRSN